MRRRQPISELLSPDFLALTSIHVHFFLIREQISNAGSYSLFSTDVFLGSARVVATLEMSVSACSKRIGALLRQQPCTVHRTKRRCYAAAATAGSSLPQHLKQSIEVRLQQV